MVNTTFFDTLTISVEDSGALIQRAESMGCNLRQIGNQQVGISIDETTTLEDIRSLIDLFIENAPMLDTTADIIPVQLQRTVDYLQHPLFNDYHSETEMMRYMRRL